MRDPTDPPDGDAALEPERGAGLRVTTTADGSRTLVSARYAQAFGSHRGALTEARHAFLAASGTAARLAAGGPARVLEVGFGTGLNFFVTAAAAATAGAELRYLALERELLPAAALAPLALEPLLPAAPVAAWLAWRAGLPDAPTPGRYRFAAGRTELELLVGEATAQPLPEGWAHAVYHDAFSPDANPEPWAAPFLGRLAAALTPGGALVTYTVAGAVRRRLAAAGLAVEKLPGPPGGKRETLRARRPG